jgi:two-component system CheB/CheR fusion protein
MQHRNQELTQLNNDLVNLLASVNIPIVMLDADLSIRRITPQADEVLGVSAADIGRPIRHIRLRLNVPKLEEHMLDVIGELQPKEIEVHNSQNHHYRLRITPYRTMDNRIEGVVLAFIDVDGMLKRVDGGGGKTRGRKSRASTGK